MKKLFLLALPFLFVACKGTEQYRAGVEELSGKWDATTTSVSDFAAMVSTDLTNFTQAASAIQVDPAVAAKLNADQKTALEAAQTQVTTALSAYGPLQQSINDYVTTWSAKSAEVTALKDGLAAGKLEGDVAAKLTELNAEVEAANENVKAWTASYATVKAGVESALANLNTVVSGLAAPMAKK
jgi:hypothetical protein